MKARLRLAEAEFALAMTLLFALSLLAVYAGVAAIVGAFLAGMALSETADRRVTDLTNGVTELLVPFFLVGIGCISTLRHSRGPLRCVAGSHHPGGAFVSKFVGCGLGAISHGAHRRVTRRRRDDRRAARSAWW